MTARTTERAGFFDRDKVLRARARLAAGHYDSQELLDSLVEAIIADLTR